MNYEEALEITQKSHDELRHIPEQDNLFYTWRVIEALEKQIPKKPNDIVCCPSCKREVELQPIDTEEVTYCLHCGQALDWSDDDDV